MLTAAELLQIKAVTRLSVRDCGGQEAATEATPRLTRHQSMSDFGNVNMPEKFIRLDDAAILDRFSGVPRFARMLAELAGYILVRRPNGAGGPTVLGRITGEAMRETGEIFAKLGAALDDGRISASEDTTIAKEIDEALVALATLREVVHAEAQDE